MKRKILFIHIAFWLLSIIVYVIWFEGRITIFRYFVGNYKDISFIVLTNKNQVTWYLLTSIFKISFFVFLIYYGLRRLSFKHVILVIFALFLAMFLEGMVSYIYYKSLISTPMQPNLRITWRYKAEMVFQIYLIILVVAIILTAARNWLEQYNNLSRLYKTEQIYRSVKDKLDPHFMFNTLNNVYELSLSEGSTKVSEALLHLTSTLRFTLETSQKNKIPLTEEVNAIHHFIALQKARLGEEELKISFEYKIEKENIEISPLILLNYIENAFKHGFSYGKHSEVAISLMQTKDEMQMIVKNTDHASRNNLNGGNEKTKKILDLNYANKHRIKHMKVEGNHILELWLNLS